MTFSLTSIKALTELTESIPDLSVAELNILIVLSELVIGLLEQKKDIMEYSEVITQLKPLIAKELEFRSRDTQGTV